MPRNDIHFGCAATIECSYQPLDISFHPIVSTIVAAALVDGTVEVHDYVEMVSAPTVASVRKDAYENDEEENDTIVSSTQVHYPTMSKALHETTSSSCCTVQFSKDGTTLWTGGGDGHIVALDTKQICTFTAANATTTAATTPQLSKDKNKNTLFQYRIPNAGYNNIAPIQVLYEIPERHLLASGDDVGCVRLWDPRLMDHHQVSISNHNTSSSNNEELSLFQPGFTKKSLLRGCVADWKVHDDYVSAIQHSAAATGQSNGSTAVDTESSSSNTLLSTSADGTLVVYDIRMTSSSTSNNSTSHHQSSSSNPNVPSSLPYGVLRQSDPQDDELLSLCIMKHGKKVVCGTTEGVLSIFSYGTWGDVSDRYPGHPSSIDAILKIDEDTILTGSSDGLIRVVSIQPNQFIGVLGDNHEGFPIEQLQFACDRSYVGSVTHDNYIRLWDARILDENYDDGDDDIPDEMEDEVKMAAAPLKSDCNDGPATTSILRNDNNNSDDEWEDMDEDMDEGTDDNDESDNDDNESDDDDSESDDMSDGGGGENSKKKGSSKNKERANRLKSERERFFDDL
jgi:WD40 repeat protein